MNTLRTLTLPAYWAPYLINADDSNLNANEIASIRQFLAIRGLPDPIDVGDTYFSWRNDANTGLGGDVADYTFIMPARKLG